jgi:hypothetical protein
MFYLEDSTEQGKKCKVSIKGELTDCEIICSFERKIKNTDTTIKYRLRLKNGDILDNVLKSDIVFKK